MLKLFQNIERDNESIKKTDTLHPMLLMVIVVVVCAFMSFIIPAGQYERVESEDTGREIVVPDSFRYVEKTPVNLLVVLESLTLGMQEAAGIIFFLLIILSINWVFLPIISPFLFYFSKIVCHFLAFHNKNWVGKTANLYMNYSYYYS